MAVFSARKLIEDEVTRNLLSAHKRIAKEGEPKQIIKLSRYILRLAKKRNELIEGR